ncbi:hypothetical protein Tco_1555624 [Tanacetum coccineum]
MGGMEGDYKSATLNLFTNESNRRLKLMLIDKFPNSNRFPLLLGLHNWYQSLVAFDLGSTRFCRKVEDGVKGCKVRFLMVLFSEDISGSWKSVAVAKDIG